MRDRLRQRGEEEEEEKAKKRREMGRQDKCSRHSSRLLYLFSICSRLNGIALTWLCNVCVRCVGSRRVVCSFSSLMRVSGNCTRA